MRLGAKASPKDVATMAALPHVTFVETVLWGDDLKDGGALAATAAAYCDAPEVVVHVPFTIPGGAEVDVASSDPALREASCEMWAASCDLAERLDARWVILHPGGIVPRSVADDPEQAGPARADALEHLEAALLRLDAEYGKDRLLMENMPSHYHRSSGTSDRSLLGIGLLDLAAWRDLLAGICLDTSHAWLSPGGLHNLETFLRRGDDQIRHLHLSDARAPDHEGLQVGDGDIPWDKVRDHLAAIEPAGGLTAVPEIKGGHTDDGAGFRFALEFFASHFT